MRKNRHVCYYCKKQRHRVRLEKIGIKTNIGKTSWVCDDCKKKRK